MDSLINDYQDKSKYLKQIAPKANENLLMALQHFQGFERAKKYLEILRDTRDINKAEEALSTKGNIKIYDYLKKFIEN